MWNSLAGLVVEAETLGVFKTRLDTVCNAIRLLGKLSSRYTLVVVKGWMSCSCHYVMFHHSILSLFRWKRLRICWVCPCRTWSRWRTTPVSWMWMRTRTPCCSVQSSSFCSTWSCTSWISQSSESRSAPLQCILGCLCVESHQWVKAENMEFGAKRFFKLKYI